MLFSIPFLQSSSPFVPSRGGRLIQALPSALILRHGASPDPLDSFSKQQARVLGGGCFSLPSWSGSFQTIANLLPFADPVTELLALTSPVSPEHGAFRTPGGSPSSVTPVPKVQLLDQLDLALSLSLQTLTSASETPQSVSPMGTASTCQGVTGVNAVGDLGRVKGIRLRSAQVERELETVVAKA